MRYYYLMDFRSSICYWWLRFALKATTRSSCRKVVRHLPIEIHRHASGRPSRRHLNPHPHLCVWQPNSKLSSGLIAQKLWQFTILKKYLFLVIKKCVTWNSEALWSHSRQRSLLKESSKASLQSGQRTLWLKIYPQSNGTKLQWG